MYKASEAFLVTIQGGVKSRICPCLTVNPDCVVVAFCLDKEIKDFSNLPGHAFFLMEQMMEVDTRTKMMKFHAGHAGRQEEDESNRLVVSSEEWEGDFNVNRFYVWPVLMNYAKAKTFTANVQTDILVDGLKYESLGGDSKTSYNCMTWVKRHLKTMGVDIFPLEDNLFSGRIPRVALTSEEEKKAIDKAEKGQIGRCGWKKNHAIRRVYPDFEFRFSHTIFPFFTDTNYNNTYLISIVVPNRGCVRSICYKKHLYVL